MVDELSIDDEIPTEDTESSSAPEELSIEDPSLLQAQSLIESAGNPYAISKAGAMGENQIMPATWREKASPGMDVFNVNDNRAVRDRILQENYERYGNTELALQAYHTGMGNVDKAIAAVGDDPAAVRQWFLEHKMPASAEYVPKILAKRAKLMGGEETTPSRSFSVNQPSAAPGTAKYFYDNWNGIINTPAYREMPFEEKLKTLEDLYNESRQWDPEAIQLVKTAANDIWASRDTEKDPSVSDIVGPAPYLTQDDKNPEQKIASWKNDTRYRLHDEGINTLLLGDYYNQYLDQEGQSELDAFKRRNASIFSKAATNVLESGKAATRGLMRVWADPLAGISRAAGLEETAQAFETSPEVFGLLSPSDNFSYAYGDDGRPIYNADGTPQTTYQGEIIESIAQMASLFKGGAWLVGKYGLKAAFASNIAYQLPTNFQNTYKEAMQEEPDHEKAIAAAFTATPLTSAEGMIDMLVVSGAAPYLTGLSKIQQAKIVAPFLAKVAAAGAVSGTIQQATQSEVIGQMLEKEVQSWGKLGSAAAVGATGAAVGRGVDYFTGQVKEKPTYIPASATTDEIATLIKNTQPNNPIVVKTFRPERYREVASHPELKGQKITTELPDDVTSQMAYHKDLTSAIQKLKDFSDSHEPSMAVDESELKDIPEDLFKAFSVEVTKEGNKVLVNKKISYVPEEADTLSALEKNIKELNDAILSRPTERELDKLITLKAQLESGKQALESLYKVDMRSNSILAKHTELETNLKKAEWDYISARTRASQEHLAPESKQYKLATMAQKARRDKAAEALSSFQNTFLSTVKEGHQDLFSTVQNLKWVNRALKNLPSDTYLNDTKAMQKDLAEKLTKRDNLAIKVKEEAEAKVGEMAGSRRSKLSKFRSTKSAGVDELNPLSGISTKEGYKVIYNNDRWYVFSPENEVIVHGDTSYKHAVESIPEYKKKISGKETEINDLTKKTEGFVKAQGRVNEEASNLKEKPDEAAAEFTDYTPTRKSRRAVKRSKKEGVQIDEMATAYKKDLEEGVDTTEKDAALQKLGVYREVVAKAKGIDPEDVVVRQMAGKHPYKPFEGGTVEAKRSRDGNVFTLGLTTEVRNYANWLIKGLGLKNVIVTTHDELMHPEFSNVLDNVHAKAYRKAKKYIKDAVKHDEAVEDGLNFLTSDKASLISLRKGTLTPENALVLTHELGHAFLEKAFFEMEPSLRNKLITDFNDKRKKLEDDRKATIEAITKTAVGAHGEIATQKNALPEISKKDLIEYYFGSEDIQQSLGKEIPNESKEDVYTKEFAEYLAYRFSKWATGEERKPVSSAKRLLRGSGSSLDDWFNTTGGKLQELWQKVSSYFDWFKEGNPGQEFESWLDDQFNLLEAAKMFKEFKMGKLTKEPVTPSAYTSEEKASAAAERVAATEALAAAIEEARNPTRYKVASRTNTNAEKAFDNYVDLIGLSTALNRYHDMADDVNKVLLGASIVKRYNEEIAQARKAGDMHKADALLDNQVEMVRDLSRKATMHGQSIEAMKVLKNLTEGGFIEVVRRDFLDKYGKAKFIDPEEFEDYIKVIGRTFFTHLQNTQEGILTATVNAARAQAEADLARKAGASESLSDYVWYNFYGSMLSGALSTHPANLTFTGLDLFLRTTADAIGNPTHLPAIIDGVLRGMKWGMTEARGALGGKQVGTLRASKVATSSHTLPNFSKGETYARRLVADYGDIFKPLIAVGKGADTAANLVSKIHRLVAFRPMAAVDAFLARTAQEAHASLITSQMIKEKIKAAKKAGVEPDVVYADEVYKKLNGTSDDWQNALKQAREEWKALPKKHTEKSFSDNTIKLRAIEIIESRRADELKEQASRYALQRTYMGKPEGAAAYIDQILGQITDGKYIRMPAAKIIVPFARTVSNMLGSYLDYTPIGILRAAFNMPITSKLGLTREKTIRLYSPAERSQKAIIGIASTAAAAAVMNSLMNHIDEEDPKVAIYGKGPTDKGEREAWLKSGKKPYSIYVKDWGTSVSIGETPFAFMAGLIGNVMDQYRWKKDFKEKDLTEKFMASASLMGDTVTQLSVLRSLNDFVKAYNGQGSFKDVLVRPAKNVLPASSLLKDIENVMTPFSLDSKSIRTAMVANVPFFEDKYANFALDGFGERIEKPGRFYFEKSKDPVWQSMTEKGIHLPGIPGKVEVGTGSSASQKAMGAYYLKNRENAMERMAFGVFTPQEMRSLVEISGPRIKTQMRTLLKSGLKGEELQKKVDSMVAKERNIAKMEVLGITDKNLRRGILPD